MYLLETIRNPNLKKPREIYDSRARREDIYVIYIIRLFIQSPKYNFKLVFLGVQYKTINFNKSPIIKSGAGLNYSIKFN